MLEERKLNVNIAEAIGDLQSMLKEFRLKREVWKLFFRGKGLEFEQYRNFTPDDDASMIDWKVSNRAQKLLVKQYKEERDLKIFFVIDVGDNMVFGSTPKLKCEYVTELVAAFSMVMLKQNDQIGYILFSDDIKDFVPPKVGEKHFQMFVDHLSDGVRYGGLTNLDLALDFTMDNLSDNIDSIVFVSDFLNVSTETEKKLSLLANRFETIVIRVRDPLDITLPEVDGELVVEDSATHQQLVMNPKIARKVYEHYAFQKSEFARRLIKKTDVDFIDLTTDKPFAPKLAIFLKERIEGY